MLQLSFVTQASCTVITHISCPYITHDYVLSFYKKRVSFPHITNIVCAFIMHVTVTVVVVRLVGIELSPCLLEILSRTDITHIFCHFLVYLYVYSFSSSHNVRVLFSDA